MITFVSFYITRLVGRISKLEVRYWIETDSFVHSSTPIKRDTTNGIKGTRYPFIYAPHTQKPHKPSR